MKVDGCQRFLEEYTKRRMLTAFTAVSILAAKNLAGQDV